MENDWTTDIECVLENIRQNCVVLSNEHKTQYFYLKYILQFFRLPVIIISGVNSIVSVGFQPYLNQGAISITTCILALACSIIGSIELYLAIQKGMENELVSQQSYYLLGVDIYKNLSLSKEHRPIPFSKTTTGTFTALYLDDTTTPLTYNPSTSTLTATIFSTATAPVSANQLGNKTYIDNYGGGAGWYYTANVNNGGASSTTFAFPNCFSNNLNNAYEVYFIFNFSAPTSGYPGCSMSFTGLGTTTYNNWTTSTSASATPTITNAYTNANQFLNLLNSTDVTSSYLIRSATPKINIWGAISNSGGSATSQTQFSAENFGISNPGLSGIYKTFGYTQQLSGYITGTTLTFSSAMTGTATIIVKGRA